VRIPVFLIACFLGMSAHAHEGHDHGDEAKPVVSASIAPRFEARGDLFELVGILNGKEWWLYLDKAESNEPVEQAVIEIESGSFKGKAVASQDVFKLAAPALAEPGSHALTIMVEAGEESDLLTASFEIKAAEIKATEMKAADSMGVKAARSSGWLAYAGVAIVLALLIAAVIRMRKRT
jgi:hypothetical protein